ncbi:MAG: hypothetical protein JSW10_03540 [Pseudomonadota bacterium]|nr:MAG: hypothetical protein JSW10_03540 [Pseudomonadota bacterium]
MEMKKLILGIIVVVAIAIGIGLYLVFANLDAIVKAAIEKYGSQATSTAVRVDGVTLNLKDGAGAINGLTVANPKGFSTPYVFSLGSIGTQIDLGSVMEDPVVIEDITVRAPEVFYEMNAERTGNLDVLKDSMAKSAPSQPATKQEDTTKEKGGAEPKFIIRRLHFSEGTLNATLVPLDNKQYTLKLPTIDMSNLGGKSGATGSELAQEILRRLTDRAIAVVKKEVLDKEVDKLRAEAKEKVEAEKAKLKAKSDEKIEAEKQKARDRLKGALGR